MRRTLTSEILVIEEIPAEVIDDLAGRYDVVEYDLDSAIDDLTLSLKSKYETTESELSECHTVDFDLMLPVIADGYVGKHYIVRANKIPNGISVAEIRTAEVFTIETVITELPIPPAP